ncbi:MAG: UDP-N-acetylglucosamine 2-epimerase (non-hydrolyzing) [Bacteroidales bacterium]
MKRILTVIGARPQFIKAAPVSKAIENADGLSETIIHTGQHFDRNMSQVFFDQMKIPRPAYSLDIHSLPHGAMTGRMTEKIEHVLQAEQPDWVMVYGDTNSTLAGALAASKMHIPVAHVEAGLRSYNNRMPEEINRILTDRISSLLFCPTTRARENLLKEGFENFSCQILNTGDVMYDAALYFKEQATPPDGLTLPSDYILATVHREENTNDRRRLSAIIHAFNALAEQIPVVLPLHPRLQKLIQQADLPALSSYILTTDPVGYLEMMYLLRHCRMVLTDSGGLQKEACFFQKPCITLREETEWTELVDAGYNKLAGNSLERILSAFNHFEAHPPAFTQSLYGKGNASTIIAEAFTKQST